MANFNKAFLKVIKAEGGYVNDKEDKGGETYLGIARRFHPNSLMWQYIDEYKRDNPKANNSQLTIILKKDTRLDTIAKRIYREFYWDKIRGNDINSQKLSEQLFDMSVNAGIKTAVKLMQRLFGTYETGIVNDSFINIINNYAKRQKITKI